jgi:hypothetical protein
MDWLSQNIADYITGDVCQPKIASGVTVGELFVV